MSAILPDILLLALGFKVIFLGMFQKDEKSSLPFHLSWFGLTILLVLYNLIPINGTQTYFGSYQITANGILLRQVFVISALLATLLSRNYFLGKHDGRKPALQHQSEFLGILIFSTFGMVSMVSASDLISFFIGLELSTIPLYFLTAYHKTQSSSAEAATKYILIGSASTALMLFGLSYLYGLSGSLLFSQITAAVAQNPQSPLLWLAVLLIFSAISFKLTLFPFHMWAPDVYEGAPTPVTAFLSVSSKAAAISFLMILVYGPLQALHGQLHYLILLLAGATMTVGNLGAMRQSNLRRFMGYSSIAQAGYILMALTGPAASAWGSVIFYLFVYAVTNYTAFFIFSIVGEKRGEDFRSLRGLSKQSPALAGVLSLTMFSLAGIPPVAGFLGKFMLFASTAEAGYYNFIIFAAANSTISLYYYLLVLKEAYISEPNDAQKTPLAVHFHHRVVLTLLAIAVLGLGLIPHFSQTIDTIARSF
jgi:NADH-quinone oxidoreductase subunit N